MRIAVIADTHFPQRGRSLPEACAAHLIRADVILHAGDHCDIAALGALRQLGPRVISVHGNVDDRRVRSQLPHEVTFDADGTRIAMIHDAGPAPGRLARLRRIFPDARVVVFGHSHIPLIERAEDGFMILNPGSPTDRRRQPVHTMAELVLSPGHEVHARIIALDGTAGAVGQND